MFGRLVAPRVQGVHALEHYRAWDSEFPQLLDLHGMYVASSRSRPLRDGKIKEEIICLVPGIEPRICDCHQFNYKYLAAGPLECRNTNGRHNEPLSYHY